MAKAALYGPQTHTVFTLRLPIFVAFVCRSLSMPLFDFICCQCICGMHYVYLCIYVCNDELAVLFCAGLMT